MNLRSRLRALEQALGGDLSSFCETCGYPSTARDLQVVASEDEDHGKCAGCGRDLDRAGSPLRHNAVTIVLDIPPGAAVPPFQDGVIPVPDWGASRVPG